MNHWSSIAKRLLPRSQNQVCSYSNHFKLNHAQNESPWSTTRLIKEILRSGYHSQDNRQFFFHFNLALSFGVLEEALTGPKILEKPSDILFIYSKLKRKIISPFSRKTLKECKNVFCIFFSTYFAKGRLSRKIMTRQHIRKSEGNFFEITFPRRRIFFLTDAATTILRWEQKYGGGTWKALNFFFFPLILFLYFVRLSYRLRGVVTVAIFL